jgi:hypothetical protein
MVKGKGAEASGLRAFSSLWRLRHEEKPRTLSRALSVEECVPPPAQPLQDESGCEETQKHEAEWTSAM